MVGKVKKAPAEPAVLPFQNLSQLLLFILFIPGWVVVAGARGEVTYVIAVIYVFLWWSNNTIFCLCRLRHFLLRYWICKALFQWALLKFFFFVSLEWMLSLCSRSPPTPLNLPKQYQVFRMCLPQRQTVGKLCWEHSCRALAVVTLALVPVWLKAWKPSAPVRVCLLRCDYWVGDAFSAPGWSTSGVWS